MGRAEIIKDFLVESNDGLDSLDQELIALESHPHDRETLDSIFRTIHSIKGTSGFLAFNKLERLTHLGESLLVRMRDGFLKPTPEITTVLLAMFDGVRQMLMAIEQHGSEGEQDHRELIARLTQLLNRQETKTVGEEKQIVSSGESAELRNIGEILVRKGVATRRAVQEAIDQQSAGDPRHVGEILVEKGAVKPKDVVEALQSQQQARVHSASDSSIRVEVAQLERLMECAAELASVRNHILQHTTFSGDPTLVGAGQRLNRLATELQARVTKMRMQPIGNLWSKFPRTVRDLALDCGKQIRIEMQGKETELDRAILEAIKDPLTHLIRNAVDHGIEPVAVRIAAGKSPEGCVLLQAFHKAGQTYIEVTDDGAGLDFPAIRQKAVEKGIIPIQQAANMSEEEMSTLIFLPGFSTSERVTNFSGRGVGMDVVKTNVERVSGTVEVQSIPGRGCTVRMKIPPASAKSGGHRAKSEEHFASPQPELLRTPERSLQVHRLWRKRSADAGLL